MACIINKIFNIPCISNPLILDLLAYLVGIIVIISVLSILYDLFATARFKARRYHKKGEKLYKKGKHEKAEIYYFLSDHFRNKIQK